MTDSAKLEAIRSWPEPTNQTEVWLRFFLGLASNYWQFENFTEVARPLHV